MCGNIRKMFIVKTMSPLLMFFQLTIIT